MRPLLYVILILLFSYSSYSILYSIVTIENQIGKVCCYQIEECNFKGLSDHPSCIKLVNVKYS